MVAKKKMSKDSKSSVSKQKMIKKKNPLVPLLIVLAVAIVALLILLSLPQDSIKSSTTPVTVEETPTWSEIIIASSEAEDELTEYTITYNVDISVDSEADETMELSSSGLVLVDVPNKELYSKTVTDMSFFGLSSQESETYIIGDAIYGSTTNPITSETTWIIMNSTMDVWELMESATLKEQTLQIMEGFEGEVLDTLTLNGEKVYKVFFSIDIDDLTDLVSDYELFDSSSVSGMDMGSMMDTLSDMIEKMEVTLYIRTSDYMVVKGEFIMILSTEGIPSAGAVETVTIIANMDFDYTSPVDIALPEEAKNASPLYEMTPFI